MIQAFLKDFLGLYLIPPQQVRWTMLDRQILELQTYGDDEPSAGQQIVEIEKIAKLHDERD
jgi:Fe-S-cluster formation regulator IscX/YfhJ